VEMFQRVAACHNLQAQPVAGERQCNFCRAKQQCQAYQQFGGAMVPAMLSVLDVPMQQWTPEQRALAANRLGAAQDFLDELKSFLKDSLQADPRSVPGWKLTPGVVKETIVDPQALFDRFCKLAPEVPADRQVANFMRCVAVGKTKLRQAVADLGLKGKALNSTVKDLCEGLTERKTTAPTLDKE